MFAYCGNNPVCRIDPNGMDYRPVGAGIQLELDVGCYTGGFEVILYWDNTICDNGGWIVALYSYDGLSLDMTDPLAGSIVATVLDNTDLLMSGTEESMNSLLTILKGNVSASASGVLIFGDESFTSTESYEGPFTSVSGNIGHIKGSFAYSSNSYAFSVGATCSKKGSRGFSRTNYTLLTEYQFDSVNKSHTRKSRAVSILERELLI